MKDKILKQIEEEALKLFPLDEYDDELFSERYNWSNGAKYGYNIKDSVDKCSCCHEVINGQSFCIDCFKNNIRESVDEKWVSVEDGFPFIKNGCNVIVIAFYPQNNMSFTTTFDGRFYPDNEMTLGEPSHWMPLPKSPQ
tara:strand:- start:933 stop:1349 length:417 start_codon:yes stop_codon:yes gene_type:complete